MVLLLAFMPIALMAQKHITGNVVDKQTGEPLSLISVVLNEPSTTKTVKGKKKETVEGKFVTGCVTDSIGRFDIVVSKDGNYEVKISSVGYKTVNKPVKVAGENLELGYISISDDAVLLNEVVATGQAAKVVVKEDTFVYNAAAYHTPEGSVVEELVKRLPGAQVSEDGSITINGKSVKKIKVDGKEFMTGDTETALKNLPTSIIEKVRAYDEKSDQARITGVDDGEEETVLDFGIKPGMNRGTMLNADLAYGTKDRYAERIMASYMQDDISISTFGSFNNVGGRGFPGGGGGFRGGGGNGRNTQNMLGLNLNYQNKKILTIDGSLRWNHRLGDVWQRSSNESFVGSMSSFGNSISQSYSRATNWNGQMRLEWNPDSMTNIMFRPSIQLSKNDSRSTSASGQFNDDPYKYTEDPLAVDADGNFLLAEEDIVVNSDSKKSLSYSDRNNVRGMAQITRKFGNKGRNVSLQVNGNYSDGESLSASTQDIKYYLQIGDVQTADRLVRRYSTTPTKNYGFNARATYSEPLGHDFHLQFAYNFSYNKNKSDRATYSYDNNLTFGDWKPTYRRWDDFLNHVADPMSDVYKNKNLSKYSEYDNYTQEAQILLRKASKDLTMSVGFMAQPQHSDFKYRFMNVDTIVKRNVLNFSPSLDVRYKFDKVTQLRATYRGSTSQPSITDMLDITDDSDAQNVTKGNPGLKPSFTQNFNLRFNTYIQSHMQSLMTFINASTTSNSISQSVQYDPSTGIRTTRPENISGNWNAMLGLMYNASIDSAGVWNINTFGNINHQNHMSYLFLNNQNMKNKTRSTSVMERIAFSYRSAIFDIEPNGMIQYTHSRNALQTNSNLDTWMFNYGINVTVNMPWGTSMSTDAGMNSRRGYNEKSMNTNEFIWNAQISHSFFMDRSLTVSLQFYDILHNQSSFSRTISAMERRDTEYNTINSYAMLHVIYRLNKFGGKNRIMDDGRMPNFGRPEFNRGGGPGTRGGGPGGPGGPGGFGGGFGGGRPRF